MKTLFSAMTAAIAAITMTLCAFADVVSVSVPNPMTGDFIGRYIWVIMIIAGVSLAVVIVLASTTSKKNTNKKK